MRISFRIGLALLLFFFIQSCRKEDDKEIDNTIKDIDNNVYTSVIIGTQEWMVENLKTTRYRNGDLIGTTTPATLDITSETTPKYQWAYEGNESNVNTNGRLYTWYAVTDPRNVCPAGWHVPTDSEWTTLTAYLTNKGYGYTGNGDDIAKSIASTSGWITSLIAGTPGNDQTSNNSSGFTALPGGFRHCSGSFNYVGNSGFWWSSTEFSAADACSLSMLYYNTKVTRYFGDKLSGFFVRCIKD